MKTRVRYGVPIPKLELQRGRRTSPPDPQSSLAAGSVYEGMSSVIAINTQQNLNYWDSHKYLGSVVYVSKYLRY